MISRFLSGSVVHHRHTPILELKCMSHSDFSVAQSCDSLDDGFSPAVIFLDVKSRYDPQGQRSFRGLLARCLLTIILIYS